MPHKGQVEEFCAGEVVLTGIQDIFLGSLQDDIMDGLFLGFKAGLFAVGFIWVRRPDDGRY